MPIGHNDVYVVCLCGLADGLTDCEDPDCCIDMACRDDVMHCRVAPDPMEILLRKQPPSTGASFYDRMRFLVEDDSVQSYATLSSFNQTLVDVDCCIRSFEHHHHHHHQFIKNTCDTHVLT